MCIFGPVYYSLVKMIQSLHQGWSVFKKRPFYFFLFLIIASEIWLMIKYPIKYEDLQNLTSQLLTFSSIVVAILITYIMSKVFQIRNERIENRKEIIRLSNQVTNFRRICNILKNNLNFWPSQLVSRMRGVYKDLNYFDIQNQQLDSSSQIYQLRQNFWADSTINKSAGQLYSALESLCLDKNNWSSELHDSYDHDLIYPLEVLHEWIYYYNANELWYWFNHEYREIRHVIDFTSITSEEKKKIESFARKIDSNRYKNPRFNESLLADLGTDFESHYFALLYERTKENNSGLPQTINLLLWLTLSLIIIGVLVPIILLALTLPDFIERIITSSIINIMTAALLLFLWKFKSVLFKEVSI